jgi:site-specific DNA recombinase
VEHLEKVIIWNKQLLSGEVKSGTEIQNREKFKSYGYIANILDLRFLAPSIIEFILNGTQPRNLTIKDLFNIKTLDWNKQRKVLNY